VARKKKGWNLKVRADAKLDYLSYGQHELLCKWLLTRGLTYPMIVKKIKREFKIDVSHGIVCEFYKNHVIEYLTEIRNRAVEVAAGYVDDTVNRPGKFTAAAIDALEQRAMEASLDPNVHPKDLKVYVDIVIRWHELRIRADQVQLQLKRLKMLERKQKKLEAVLDVESKLNSDEVAQRVRLIFKQNGENKDKHETSIPDRLPPLTAGLAAPISDEVGERRIPIQDGGASEADGEVLPNGM
jgi:hypothetical protein